MSPLLARFNELCRQPEVGVQTDPVIMRNMKLPPPSPHGLVSCEATALTSRRLIERQDKNKTKRNENENEND